MLVITHSYHNKRCLHCNLKNTLNLVNCHNANSASQKMSISIAPYSQGRRSAYNNRISSHNKGFTLTELVIVIIILSILAAYGIPKYLEISLIARKTSVNALAGTLRSAAISTRLTAKTRGISSGTVTIDSTTNAKVHVDPTTYYPLADCTIGIVETMESYDGSSLVCQDNDVYSCRHHDHHDNDPYASTVLFTLNAAKTPESCYVAYSLDNNGVPVYQIVTSGC